MGGGTFDVTLAKIDREEIVIIGSDGDHELGGKDWDDCIARYLASEFLEKYGIDVSEDPEMAASLLVTAENVKKQLTLKDTVKVPIAYGATRGVIEITEQTFEEISQFLIGATKDVTERLLESVEIGWNQIDGVILVGGSTRMRMIRNYVVEMSGKEPLGGVNVDEAVALGAAIRANITAKGESIPAMSGFLGCSKTSKIGIQGAKAVTDVTAHSLGMIAISAKGEKYVNSIIIKKNTKIPASNTRSFHFRTRMTANEMEIYVLQGEFSRPLDNTIINKYVISDIERAMSPTSVIEVTYEYNSDGVIEVAAIQKETSKKLPINIEEIPEDMNWTDESPEENRESGGISKVDVFLTVDLSGSMSGEPIKEAKKAMKKFVDEMDSRFTRIGLIPFANIAKCNLHPTDDYASVKHAIDQLEITGEYGYGNSAQPFDISYEKLVGSSADIKYIVVLTDGLWSYSDKAIAAAKRCHEMNIEVMALGFGSADHDFLKKIASTDAYASLTNLAGLGGSFSKIAQAIGEGATSITVLEE